MTGFSREGLIDQLSSSAGDIYTESQATYGARQAGRVRGLFTVGRGDGGR